ncbi:MAG: hypothetical protein K1060chlam2_00292 [Chlamydiae bacterium]|nr:hypothetical protein [Chlamydiota bacterium]
MKIVFLGTRGEIKPKSKSHLMHTSTLLVHNNQRIMIDCGTTWLGKIKMSIVSTYILNMSKIMIKINTTC